jgi:hypothetical protein
MKKSLLMALPAMLFLSIVSLANAFDLSQEVNQNAGTIKIDEKISLDIEAQTFSTNVNFATKTINDLDSKYDTQKYEDKGFGAFSLSFLTKTGEKVENSKALKLSIIGLDSYKTPVLLKSSSGTIEEIAGKDDLGSFVFTIEKSPTANYKIVEKGTSAEPKASTTLTSTTTESGSTMASEEVSLETKDTK